MGFTANIAPYVEKELRHSDQAISAGDPIGAFVHLEAAHVLGQESTYWHVKVHWRMLLWGVLQHDCREIGGQFVRLIGAALLTVFGLVPIGNTGGSNVSMITPMPIEHSVRAIIESARRKR